MAEVGEVVGECAWCGAPLVRKGRSGPLPRYCNGTCRARACTARAAEDGRAEQWSETSAKRRKAKRDAVLPWAVCIVCLGPYQLVRADAWCPSEECRRVLHSLKSRTQVGAYRVRQHGDQDVVIENVRAIEVFQRDGWTCHICYVPTSRNLMGRAPADPTVDHVESVVKGGDHRLEGLATAHRRCNQAKGAGTVEEARARLADLPPLDLSEMPEMVTRDLYDVVRADVDRVMGELEQRQGDGDG